jgi:dynein intermediate chain 2, axonemal
VLTLQVSDYALHTIRPTVEGKHLAVGGVDGSVTLLEMSPALYTTTPNEKLYIGRMFENESLRDKNLDKAAKEKKALSKKQKSQSAQDKDASVLDEQQLQTVSEKYLTEVTSTEEQHKKDLDLLEAKRAKLMEDIEEGLEIED